MFKSRMLILLLLLSAVSANAVEVRDVLGVTHAQPGYTFSSWYSGGNNDHLNEGAAQISQLGSRVIKVWFHPNGMAFYPATRPGFPYINEWDTDNRLVALAQTPQYSTLFSNPNFKTYILVVLPNNQPNEPVWQDGMSQAEKDQERIAMKTLTEYLYQTYRYSGKTFVLQNWEGDHLLRGCTSCNIPVPVDPYLAMLGMRDWINARQAGVAEARSAAVAAYPASTVRVVHAAEANLVYGPATGNPPSGHTMVNDVIPYTNCDLYSYSVWDINSNPDNLTVALNYLQAKAPDSALYGAFNIYVGEYGGGENAQFGGDGTAMEQFVRRMTEKAISWGARYVVYWQLYSNQNTTNFANPKPANGSFAGLWLIRADASKPPLYATFERWLGYTVHRFALQASSGYYVSPDAGGGYAIRANASQIKEWEYLSIVDTNGGTLLSGDVVFVMTWRANFFMAYDGGGQYMDATATHALEWETFTMQKTVGTGAIGIGSEVVLRARSGHYIYPQNGGGPGDLFFWADSSSIGTWQKFTVASWGW